MKRPAVFFDRDGTLVEENGYLLSVDNLRILPGAVEAVRKLCDAGIPAVIATNQAAIAKGQLTEAGLRKIHDELVRRFAAGGARFEGIYHCPHHPTEGNPPYVLDCGCRKPQPGLLLRAARDLGLDLSRSLMIGDAARDAVAGLAAGCAAAWVGKTPPADLPGEAGRYPGVLEAVDVWLRKR